MSMTAMMNAADTGAVRQNGASAGTAGPGRLLFYERVPDIGADAARWSEAAKQKQEIEKINSRWAEKIPNTAQEFAERDAAKQLISELNSEISRLKGEGYVVEIPGQPNGNEANARRIRRLEACRDELGERFGLDTSPKKAEWGKLAVNTIQRGADAFSGGIAATMDMLARGAADILMLGGMNDETWDSLNMPTTALKKQLDRESAQHEREFETAAGDSSWARILGDVGAATVAALPQAGLAMATGGASLGSTAAGLQAASMTANGGMTATIYNAAAKLANDQRLWLSFAQTAGRSYEQAKADGADETNAFGYAVTNGLLNALIEVGGGGIDTLPAELRAAEKPGGAYDFLRNCVNTITGGDADALPASGKNGGALLKWAKSAAEEGGEEVVQGATERGLQNAFYNKGNPLVSLTDPSAVLNPLTSAKEWGMGSVVGGILGAGQVGANKVIGAINQSGSAKVQSAAGKKPVSPAQVTARLMELLKPYNPAANYWRNCEAMGRPLDVYETIAIDSINDGLAARPNKLAAELVGKFGWDAVFGDDSTNLVMDNSTTELYDGYKPEAAEQKQVKEPRKSELEYGVAYGDRAINADGDYIYSDKYAAKFGSISPNPKVVEAIRSVGRQSVMENSGTMLESMYLIDADTGEIIASIDDPADKIKSGVHYTDAFRSALEAAKKAGRSIIALHNHPEGYPPSADDIMKAAENGYKLGIVCGSNGQVYMYRPCEGLTKKMCDRIQDDIIFNVSSGYDVDRAYKQAFSENNIDYIILR